MKVVEIKNPSDDDDDDDIPLSSLINDRSFDPGPMKSNYKWRRGKFQTSNETDWKDIFSVDESWYKKTSFIFFQPNF